MFYLSQMLGKPVIAKGGEQLGTISDIAIATGEVFPRITSLAFQGPGRTPLMISWRKYVEDFDGDQVTLNVDPTDVRFSYLQPDEILLSRDLMNKQIVDTQGLKVVRVNDLKFSSSRNQLRLLGAEVGMRGLLRGLSPHLENGVLAIGRFFKHPLQENIIAWNYMDLLERDLSQVKLSMTHRRLHELHPADVADIIEQLDPQQRASVFEHLDTAQAADAISELEDEYQSEVVDGLDESRASTLLAQMDPDDAADIIGDLPYEKAETLLRLMGVKEERAIRRLLGYKEKTAGGIMTTEFFAVPEDTTVGATIEKLRSLPEDHEPVQYVYVIKEGCVLTGVVTMRNLVLANDNTNVSDLAFRDLITVTPDEDQEEVANAISKYSLLAMPVVDEDDNELLGIVTFDDAFDVMEEEHDEDLAIAGAQRGNRLGGSVAEFFSWFIRREAWFLLWTICACVLAATGTFDLFLGALSLMPLVLIAAVDVANYSIDTLLEYEEDDVESSIGKVFGRDVLVGLLAAFICVLAISAFTGVVGDMDASILVTSITAAMIPCVLTVFLCIACSAPLAAWVRHRHEKGHNISGFGLSLSVMVLAVLLQLLLTYAFILIQGIV